MHRFTLAAAAAVLATSLSACASDQMASTAAVGTPTDVAVTTRAAPTSAPTYLAMAGAADQFEIQSSRLALQKSANARVIEFARMMVSDHNNSTQQLVAAARTAGISPPPPVLNGEQRAMLDQLRGLSGPAFDAAYGRAQVAAHQEALALHRAYAAGGDTPVLRTAAGPIVAVVQRHLDHARMLPGG
jgi:putative membrane protein